MQKNLIDTEQRIALARGYFNDIATQYNTRLEIVPERYVAGLAAMKPQTLMAANDFERRAGEGGVNPRRGAALPDGDQPADRQEPQVSRARERYAESAENR